MKEPTHPLFQHNMSISKGVWSNASRAASLSVKNPVLKQALLSPNLPNGPASLKANANKRRYTSPIGLDGIYPLAYELLEKQAEEKYQLIDQLNDKISKDGATPELIKQREELQIEAEINNPQVVYNALFATNVLDRTQPVYRHYLKKNWESYKKMLTMQRIETLAVIPDTLPTLEPEVDVNLKFTHNNVDTWIEPGNVLSSNVTCKPPTLEIVEFKESTDDLYTVLIVNPDTPDVENNTYSTTLHWGLANVRLSNNDSIIDMQKLSENPDIELIDYLPPVPEKNLGKQRFAVWVFRQDGQLPNKDVTREKFDIRAFVGSNKLQPVGAHVWRSTWDLNVANVRKMYGLPEGRIFSRDRF